MPAVGVGFEAEKVSDELPFVGCRSSLIRKCITIFRFIGGVRSWLDLEFREEEGV